MVGGDWQRHFKDSTELCTYMRAKTIDTVVLSFSCGKDALAAWLKLRDHFERIIPYYLWLIPDLEFVEESLHYYERFFGQKIERMPHPSFWRMLDALTFQPPERAAIIEKYEIPKYDYDDIAAWVRHHHQVPDAFTATGVRAVDSPIRWQAVKTHGPINLRGQRFMPVYDWRLDDVVGAIQVAGVKLPIEYRYFGRTFDGLDYRFLVKIKETWPRDYQRILDWFPLAELELFRRALR